MKKQSTTLFAKFSNTMLADLTNEVKETIAFSFTEQHRTSFTTADLWNIQRQAKTRVQRRYL